MIASAPSGISDSTPDRLTLLHLAPHPDDEVMGGPAIMLELQAGGHRIVNVLDAHSAELRRNDYRRLVKARAEANAVLGPERLFGFGATRGRGELAELATEVVFKDGDWRLGEARELDPARPLAEPTPQAISAWLTEPSVTQRFGAPRS